MYWASLSSLYDNRSQTEDEAILKKQIIHAVEDLYGRPDGTGYIFIYDFNGTVLSDPVQRQNIGKNLYQTTDIMGLWLLKIL